MARPREFNESEALEKAVAVFWEHGYQGSSPKMLLEAMGLSKSSFYETFESKRELFLRCLRHYVGLGTQLLESSLSQSDIRKAVRGVYDHMIDEATQNDGKRFGCLIYNTAAELRPHDSEVEEIVRNALSGFEELYHKRLRAAQRAGKIPEGEDVRQLARYFVACNGGMLLMARAKPARHALKSTATAIVARLE